MKGPKERRAARDVQVALVMMNDVNQLHADLVQRATKLGIAVRQANLKPDVPGEFDGLSITLNREYDSQERAFYLAHSIGSIAQWSIDPEQSHTVMDRLRRTKKAKASHADEFRKALEDYLSFEERTWENSVWLLTDICQEPWVPAFTNFGRADMESMRIFHSTGKAPVWRDFFDQWNEEVKQGKRAIPPFYPRQIPEFRPVRIPKQEIVQEDD